MGLREYLVQSFNEGNELCNVEVEGDKERRNNKAAIFVIALKPSRWVDKTRRIFPLLHNKFWGEGGSGFFFTDND